MPPSLGDMVELVFGEVESTHQCLDRAIARVQRQKGSLHFGELRGLPAAFFCFYHPDHGSGADFDIWRCLV